MLIPTQKMCRGLKLVITFDLFNKVAKEPFTLHFCPLSVRHSQTFWFSWIFDVDVCLALDLKRQKWQFTVAIVYACLYGIWTKTEKGRQSPSDLFLMSDFVMQTDPWCWLEAGQQSLDPPAALLKQPVSEQIRLLSGSYLPESSDRQCWQKLLKWHWHKF